MIVARLVKKNRPSSYKVSGTPYYAGGNKGVILVNYPRPYPKTPQQKKVAEAARACGIKAGIGRADLIKAMHECIPGKF